MLEDMARRAAIYLFPLYEMYRTRWQATVNEANPFRQKLNRFFHVPVLADHRSRLVTTPNNDTLYSSAWLDLSLEPLFLTVPSMGERYYSFAFMSLFTDNFAYVCRRLDGGDPRPRMIVGPGWNGDAQNDVVLVRAPTNSVWLLGRILVDAPDDLASARALQARTLLETPDMHNERRILETRELMRQRTVLPPEAVADWPAPRPADPFDLFDVGLAALGESPLDEHDGRVLSSLAPLKLRPGHRFDARAFSDPERAGDRERRRHRTRPRSAAPAVAGARRSTAGAIPTTGSATMATTICCAPSWRWAAWAPWNWPRQPISPATPMRPASRWTATVATCCASRPDGCRRPGPSGRSPCTR